MLYGKRICRNAEFHKAAHLTDQFLFLLSMYIHGGLRQCPQVYVREDRGEPRSFFDAQL